VALYVFFVCGVSAPLFYFEPVAGNRLVTAWIRLAAVLGQFSVSAIGVWRCYLANGGRAGHRFAERFIALGWVVGVRLFLLVGAIFAVLFLLRMKLEIPWVAAGAVLFTAIYFWRVWTHISWVAQHAERVPSPDAG
jgi:hypothetical protein